jgi:hypothetical protein
MFANSFGVTDIEYAFANEDVYGNPLNWSTGERIAAGTGGFVQVAGTATVIGKGLFAATDAMGGASARIPCPPETTPGGAHTPSNAIRLNKAMASQDQLGQVGKRIAGAGTDVPFRDAGRFAQQYGGNPSDWVKMRSSSHVAPDGTRFETHWVENILTGQRVEFKTKIAGGP